MKDVYQLGLTGIKKDISNVSGHSIQETTLSDFRGPLRNLLRNSVSYFCFLCLDFSSRKLRSAVRFAHPNVKYRKY